MGQCKQTQKPNAAAAVAVLVLVLLVLLRNLLHSRVGRALRAIHDRETAAGFTGTRRLDGGVQRQQIGLFRDILDDLDDFADLVGGINLIEVIWDKNVFPAYRSDR